MNSHTVHPSIIGFKDPRADLHRQSPKILAASLLISVVSMAVAINLPIFKEKTVEKKVKAPPVIIQLENIPETRHQVRAPAPKLAIPMEVDDDLMLDDVTIESTNLDFEDVPEEVAPVIENLELVEDTVEDEIFELFTVEEAPVVIAEVAPVYPDAARQAGIEGLVFVRALVGKDGSVEQAEILKGAELLQQAALDAAYATKFTPAVQNDMPVKCWVQMSFRFVLE